MMSTQETHLPTIDLLIKGEPGSGRKTLVCQYLEHEERKFKHVLWINADNEINIEYAFRHLHLQLNLAQYVNDKVDWSSEGIVRDVYRYINNGRVLIVFLNLSLEVSLHKYLPDKIQENMFFIVTSTNMCSLLAKKTVHKKPYLSATCVKSLLLQGATEDAAKNLQYLNFEKYEISELAFRYYIGMHKFNLEEGRHEINTILDLVVEKIQETPSLMKFVQVLSLLGSNDVPLRLLQELSNDATYMLENLSRMNFVSWSLGDYYSMHGLLKNKVNSEMNDIQKAETINEIARAVKVYMPKVRGDASQCMDVQMHLLHVVKEIFQSTLKHLINPIEFVYYVISEARKLHYGTEICEQFIPFANKCNLKLDIFMTKIKLEEIKIKLQKSVEEAEIIEMYTTLETLKECKDDASVVQARLLIALEKYESAIKVLANKQDRKSKVLVNYCNVALKIISKTPMETTITILKSKTFQKAVKNQGDEILLKKCFDECKKELGIGHRKSVHAFLLLAELISKSSTSSQRLVCFFSKYLDELRENKQILSVLHPAYDKVLQQLFLYMDNTGNLEQIGPMFQQSIRKLELELQEGSNYCNAENHEVILAWSAKSALTKNKTSKFFEMYGNSNLSTNVGSAIRKDIGAMKSTAKPHATYESARKEETIVVKTYKRRKNDSAIPTQGPLCVIKLIMLIFIQAIVAGFKFELASNMQLAADFADVVINIEFPDSSSKTVFLQVKHVENLGKKITLKDLRDLKGKFSLFRYFKSYQQIIKNKSELPFNIADAEFVIYTITDFDVTSTDYFQEIVTPNAALNCFKSKNMVAYKIKPANFKSFNYLFPSCDKAEAEEYLSKLTFLVKQGNEKEVENQIKNCISIKFDEHNLEEISDIYLKSFTDYQAWWQSLGNVQLLTQKDDYFQTHSSVCLIDKLNYLQKEITNIVNTKGIEFTESCLKKLSAKIRKTGSSYLQTTLGGGILTAAKVLQLYKNEDIMFVDSEFVKQYGAKIECNFKQSEIKNTLVYHVSENAQAEQFITEILNIVKINCKKRLIVISDEQIDCEISETWQDKIRYCDLCSETQQRVGNSYITFQDKFMHVKDVLGKCEMLNDELLANVLMQEPVNIANGQIENLENLHYIPRNFKKHLVDTDIIDKCEDDVLLIQTSKNDCRHKLYSGREVRFYPESDQNRKNVYYILPGNNKSSVLQEIFKRSKNVHLLEYKNNQLSLLQSQGSMKLIMENLEGQVVLTESEIVKCCNKEKLVVISDYAGMGKTTVLKSLSNIVNEQYPGLWILKINLSQHAKVLYNIKETKAKKNFSETILNTFPYSSESEKSFLSKMFAAGRVAVFLDGFDEISPDNEKIVINLVKELQFSNVQHIYLTTRPQMREYIEENLHALAYTFVALDTEEQANFVSSEWIRKEEPIVQEKKNIISNLAKQLIAKMSSISSKQDIAICGIPLQLRMIVDIYPTFNEAKTILENSEILLILEWLYDEFFRKKIRVYCVEKLGLTPNSTKFNSEYKTKLMDALHEHQLIAIDMIFSNKISKKLLPKNDQKKLQEIYKKPNDITSYGIVSRAIPKHSEFTHRTFAEYLSALYLCSKLEEQKCEHITNIFITKVLVVSNYQDLRKFLNSIVEKYKNISRPLLILEHYIKEQEMCDFRTALHIAANEKNMKMLKFLLKDLVPEYESAKKILNSYYRKYTILQILVKSSVSREYLEEIDLLVSLGANVYMRTKERESILHLSGNNKNVLERLLRVAEEKNQLQELLQYDALLGAVLSSNLECVKLLISYGASVNWKNYKKSTLLHLASSNGSLEIVKCLVEHGANINAKNNNGWSVLYVAASNGHLDIGNYLVDHGANVNDKDNDGRSVLHVAASNGHLDIVQYLVNHGANVNDNDGSSVLHLAASNGHLDLVQYLVDHGANVNDNDGISVLHVAASNGHLDIVQYLVDHGANVNDKVNNGWSVLHEAASKDVLDIVKYLVEHGANVNDKDNDDWSVLHVAASNGHLDTVRYLVDNGANANAKNNKGWSVLYSTDDRDIKEYLLAKGAM